MKLSQNYSKTYKCRILYKIGSIKQIIFSKYATNLKTTISQRRQTQVYSFHYLNLIIFHFLIDIIDNIIYTSRSCHQNSNQWQCSITVTCLLMYHVTSILHCHWRKFGSRDTDTYLTSIRFGIILKQLYANFSRQEHLICSVQRLRFSGFILYPLSFFLYISLLYLMNKKCASHFCRETIHMFFTDNQFNFYHCHKKCFNRYIQLGIAAVTLSFQFT